MQMNLPGSWIGAWNRTAAAGTVTGSNVPAVRPSSIFARRLSEKESVYQSIVAVGQTKGDNAFSLLSNLVSRSHAETSDERTLQENVSALGAPALPAGGP